MRLTLRGRLIVFVTPNVRKMSVTSLFLSKTKYAVDTIECRVDPKDGKLFTAYYEANVGLSRKDGPAINHYDDHPNGGSWWLNGKRHRDGGPAIVNAYIEHWIFNGRFHREDGPAYIDKLKNDIRYFIEGNEIPEKDFWTMRRLWKKFCKARIK